MFTVELYAKVRHAVMIEGLSRREAAKRFGIHRNTITKMLSFSVPRGYRRRERPASRKLGPFMAWIDAILESDRSVHKKQRHTDGYIGGKKVRFHYFCVDLPHSDACFVKAYPAETTEAFLDGHITAFAFFGGVPLSILYDNLKIAMARILGDGKRQRTRAFTELVRHYLFQERLGRPGLGNDRGKDEAPVKDSRANFLTPVPHAASCDAL